MTDRCELCLSTPIHSCTLTDFEQFEELACYKYNELHAEEFAKWVAEYAEELPHVVDCYAKSIFGTTENVVRKMIQRCSYLCELEQTASRWKRSRRN